MSSSILATGLEPAEVDARLRQYGRNELPHGSTTPAWRRLLGQLFHFFALLLWGAGGLAVLAGMPQLGVAIILVIVVNGLFAFVQEHRADRAARHLGELLPRRVQVRRGGQVLELDATLIVTGDVVLLGAGDRVPADLEVSTANGLLIDMSMLTGESAPVSCEPGGKAFAGTFVVEGEGTCVVTATGRATRLAGITRLSQGNGRPHTPLARELDRLVRTVALIALGIGTAFLLIGVAVGLPLREGFLFAIGVAVALVPEGLLPTVTLSLAVGAKRMASRGALVRRLDAVETLGATTFICSDKTGTLTRNEMNVVEAWSDAGVARVHGTGYQPSATIQLAEGARPMLARLALAASRCGSGRVQRNDERWIARGDPMEAALHALALRLGLDVTEDEQRRPELSRFPFDARRRCMSVVLGDEILVKGAPDSVLTRCIGDVRAARSATDEMAARGLRVMAVARRAAAGLVSSSTEAEERLELLGILGLLDPPRQEVRSALAECRKAGIRIAMITGDHAGTARAVAEEIGMQVSLIVRGEDLPEDEALLGALVDRDGLIACRVSPEQKQRIAMALQQRGHVVAMTGDGVNDAPALRQADVGVAMGKSGTDVAREAADLVLLDDRFETIVLAIAQGRSAFANIRRFLTYHLTDNVPELAPFVVWALSGGRLPLALGVLQILCLDLLTDQSPALALGAQPPGKHVLSRGPQQIRLFDRTLLVRAALLGATEATVSLASFFAVLAVAGLSPDGTVPPATLAAASGAAFLAVLCGQAATALACRSSSRPAWQVPARDNPLLFAALAVTWAVAGSLLCVPALARLLGQAMPPLLGATTAASAFPLVLGVDALYKRISNRSLPEQAAAAVRVRALSTSRIRRR
jgi:calcium-translocating P-type ATPase